MNRQKQSNDEQTTWILQPSGLTLHPGTLLAYRRSEQMIQWATVRSVSVTTSYSLFGYQAGEQIVYVQLYSRQPYGHLPKQKQLFLSVHASDVLTILNPDHLPPPPHWDVELLYPKHAFHRLSRSKKVHVVRHETTPLWGGPDVDWSQKTLCGLPTAESQTLHERVSLREQVCGSCLRSLRSFRQQGDDWRKKGLYVREARRAVH